MTIDELVAAFEAGEIEATDFPHRRHVEVAWGLSRRYPPEDAYTRLAAGIRGIATRAGRPGWPTGAIVGSSPTSAR